MGEKPVPCNAKHTTPQIPDEEFRCPKCGGTPDPARHTDPEFVIQESAADANDDCTLLHDEDELGCSCGYGASGRTFARAYAKRLAMVKCPTCKGAGLVESPRV